jgi:hypothetical protein
VNGFGELHGQKQKQEKAQPGDELSSSPTDEVHPLLRVWPMIASAIALGSLVFAALTSTSNPSEHHLGCAWVASRCRGLPQSAERASRITQ